MMFRDLLDDLDDYSPAPGKLLDVPFVPSDDDVIEGLLSLGEVRSTDLLYDLGCGDGRIVIAAARTRGARSIGVELDPLRIADAMEEAGHVRVEYLVDFIEEDIFTVDIRDATVITLYLLEAVNLQLRPRLLKELRPGTRILSHVFKMGDWRADEQIELRGGNQRGVNLYKWIVPAQVAGVWEWEGMEGGQYRVQLEQRFQDVTGSAWLDDAVVKVDSATLCGAALTLRIQTGKTAVPQAFILNFENNALASVWVDE
ncbi:MAG: class I SAM-dependent methyltransferase [Castellaniella sp.]|uniref:class I SAM-dependent methyltransferase n=1 Tax=Castellaniella sp. TaxID=1955812 RepID=UPI003C7651F6